MLNDLKSKPRIEVKKVTKVKIENTLVSEAIAQETETTVNRYVTG